jgi:methylenetetrahydrofolate--tRNA-(uracil-5-)-methyltransferase
MKPERFSPAHSREGFAELVCSKSLKAMHPSNASALQKAEILGSSDRDTEAAKSARVPAGDRRGGGSDPFPRTDTQAVESHPIIP